MPKFNNLFTDTNAFRTIDTFRIIYLFSTVLCFFITEAGRFIYRPFIYANKINDFGIADSIGNSGGIMVQIFFTLAILNSQGKKVYRVIAFLTSGYILYEIVQTYLPRGVFDWFDIYGTIIGGIMAFILIQIIKSFNKYNKVLFQL